MDDQKSRQQIDELADLYLTGVIDETKKQQANTPDADNPVEGPAPIRLSPKPGGGVSSSTTESPRSAEPPADEPEDRHPVLRLTDSDNPQQTETESFEQGGVATAANPINDLDEASEDEPAPQAALEAVLMGNLPGMSGPWLTQYAQLIAQTDGPVAILHVGDSAIDLELVEPRAEAEPAPASTTTGVRIPPMRGNRTGLVGLLDALTRSESTPTRTILVRMESGDDAQTVSRFAAINDWTVLCGGDEASVSAAGRQLHRLILADPRLADRSVGVMVMGSDENAARTAADRVAQQMRDDLVDRVEFIGHLKRMQPVQVREIGSFPDPVGVWPQLVAWFDSLETPEPQPVLESVIPDPRPAPPQPETPEPTRAQATPVAPQRLSPAAAKLGPPASRPEPQPAFKPTPPTPPPPRTERQTAQRAAAPEPASAPTPIHAPQPKPAPAERRETAGPARAVEPTRPAPQPRVLSPQPELDLIALLDQGPAALDDPAALEARIPDQPDTQLAVDAEGIVHVLMRHDGNDTASTDARQAVMQLIEAGRWVRDHLELLALTQRDRAFIDEEPVLHLLTDRADLTTQLVGKLAGQVRLHLLQRVQLGRESGWFCTPLG